MSLVSRLGCKAFRKPLISRFPSAHNLRLRCNQYWEAPVACHMCFTCAQNVIIKIQKEKKKQLKGSSINLPTHTNHAALTSN